MTFRPEKPRIPHSLPCPLWKPRPAGENLRSVSEIAKTRLVEILFAYSIEEAYNLIRQGLVQICSLDEERRS